MTFKVTIFFSGILPVVFNHATILEDNLSTLAFSTTDKPMPVYTFNKQVIAGYTLQEIQPTQQAT
jgi:hypothetical protein